MKQYTFDKEKINVFIEKLIKKYKVIAPVKKNNTLLFKQINKPDDLTFNYENSIIPPKSIFFPQTETLFKFSMDDEIKIEETDEIKDTIIFGIRPCDAKSIKLLNNIFKNDFKDDLFLSKIKKTIFIGMSCIDPCNNCFCTSVNSGPFDTDGHDIFLTEMNDKYFVDILTNKGEKLIKIFNFLKPASNNDIKIKNNLSKKAENKINRLMKTEKIDKILDNIFDNKYWEKISKRCIGCGICTFLCPTCHCFDIQDEKIGSKGARIRVWDSCMYSEYTKQASGYNPRPGKLNRVRNRIYHKFNYFPKNSMIFGCVGCGRCIKYCPVNIDIIEIINGARQVKK